MYSLARDGIRSFLFLFFSFIIITCFLFLFIFILTLTVLYAFIFILIHMPFTLIYFYYSCHLLLFFMYIYLSLPVHRVYTWPAEAGVCGGLPCLACAALVKVRSGQVRLWQGRKGHLNSHCCCCQSASCFGFSRSAARSV